mmetsp:Transcript_14081/g.42094  ORF Transcript_14081/g.42094 Transcript_14081/m.42094 type:complete len:230 (-) Transcript_14081:68-757(-)
MRTVDVELRLMAFSSEGHLRGGFAALRAKVPQAPLAPDQLAALRRELRTPAAAAAAREIVECTTSLLTAVNWQRGQGAKSAAIAEMTLGDYAKTYLLQDGLGAAVAGVRLEQLEGLHGVIGEALGVGPFARVHASYRAELTPELRAALEAAAPGLEMDAFLPLFAAFLKDQLVEAHTNPDGSLKASLEWLELREVWLQDWPWFAAFPDAVQVRHALAAYDALAALQEAV